MIDQQIKRRIWLVCFIFTLLFGGLLLFSMFGCSNSEVSPGQTWVYIPNRDNPNPFESETRYENEVLEVKSGWVKYLSNRYENDKLTNSTIKTDMTFWFLIDSELKEKPCIK